jgi:hypothetical protein
MGQTSGHGILVHLQCRDSYSVTQFAGSYRRRWVIEDGEKPDLSQAAARREWLRKRFGVKANSFRDIKQILEEKPPTPTESGRLIFVFGDEFDTAGHEGELKFEGAEGYVERYVRGILKLRDAGYGTVACLTDHGFIHWNPEKDEILPTNADFSPRRKWLYLMRLIPMVEKNYNLVELGPRGTGKSYIYRELSPYVILISGGQVSVPNLFVSNAPPYEPGLVTRYDTVAFDEIGRSQFNKSEDKQLYKDYMEMGSFSRGSAKGTVQAEASFVFNGNLECDIETIARTSHLFLPFPEMVRNDMAFHDRWHAYLPGWEMPKMQPGYFGSHMGFIADYIAEIFHNELRPKSYADAYDRHFHLGSHVEEWDRRAIAKTVSGLVKLLNPGGECTRSEVEEYLTFWLAP